MRRRRDARRNTRARYSPRRGASHTTSPSSTDTAAQTRRSRRRGGAPGRCRSPTFGYPRAAPSGKGPGEGTERRDLPLLNPRVGGRSSVLAAALSAPAPGPAPLFSPAAHGFVICGVKLPNPRSRRSTRSRSSVGSRRHRPSADNGAQRGPGGRRRPASNCLCVSAPRICGVPVRR
jgi:hypothetical protein